MPELYFSVRWPDQSVTECYSPSTVIENYFLVGQRYSMDQFVELSRTALSMASERVRGRHGFACSSASDQFREIEYHAQQFNCLDDAHVVVEKFRRRGA